MNRFNLPLEKGSWKLTLETLNKHSQFRRPDRPFLLVKIRKIAFQNEILVIGVSIAGEEEEKIYLQVQANNLLVGCSVDTDESYLSRYAYYALTELMFIDNYYDFEPFYWPGFFNAKTGKSKYLEIINDRCGLDINLKPKYSPFYKPGEELVYPTKKIKISPQRITEAANVTPFSDDDIGLGYCLADTLLRSLHSNHWPFLIPCTLITKNNGKVIKNFVNFIKDEAEVPMLECPATQQELNKICYQMMLLAPISSTSKYNTALENEEIRYKNRKNGNRLFRLWQKAVSKIQGQKFTYHLHTYGIKNVTGKPSKKYMEDCIFSPEIPKLCFSLRDKGEYFELKLLFKIRRKVFNPHLYNTAFFINSNDDPMRFYLLNSLQDFYILSLFAKYNHCISVFRCHYETQFKPFKDQLSRVYEFI